MDKREKRWRVNCNGEEEFNLLYGIRSQCREANVNIEDVKHGWIKNKKSSLFFKNPNFKQEEEKELDLLRKDLIKFVKSEAPKIEYKKRKQNGDNLLLIDPADVHIGKLCTSFETGEDYNQQIAVQRVLQGVDGIIRNSEGWSKDEIVLIIGNDILHTDTPKRQTTSGTPQDTDGMWYENFMTGVRLYKDLIHTLLEIAPVKVIFNPSNHDYTNGFFLAQLIEAYFDKDKRVSFDCSIAHRKYYKYHNNLIGTTHGDGAKVNDLGLLMAHESAKEWAECKHRYWYMHHVHHKMGKDLIGCTIEALRSPSGTDSWHDRNGYVGSPKAIEGYIHNKEHGQLARLSHLF
jgi:hypothetical protein